MADEKTTATMASEDIQKLREEIKIELIQADLKDKLQSYGERGQEIYEVVAPSVASFGDASPQAIWQKVSGLFKLQAAAEPAAEPAQPEAKRKPDVMPELRTEVKQVKPQSSSNPYRDDLAKIYAEREKNPAYRVLKSNPDRRLRDDIAAIMLKEIYADTVDKAGGIENIEEKKNEYMNSYIGRKPLFRTVAESVRQQAEKLADNTYSL